MTPLFPGEATIPPCARSTRMRLMSTVLDLYDDTDEWPGLALVQNTMTERHDHVNAKRAAGRLPASLARTREEAGVIELTFRGIFRADPTHQKVDDFERCLRIASRRYKRRADPRTEATICVGQVIEELALDASRAEQALELLEAERILSAEGAGCFRILPEMRHFTRVRDAAGYVRVRAKRDRQRCRARKARRALTPIVGSRPMLRKVVIGALGSLLAAGVIWLGQATLFSGGPESGHRETPPTPDKRAGQPGQGH